VHTENSFPQLWEAAFAAITVQVWFNEIALCDIPRFGAHGNLLASTYGCSILRLAGLLSKSGWMEQLFATSPAWVGVRVRVRVRVRDRMNE